MMGDQGSTGQIREHISAGAFLQIWGGDGSDSGHVKQTRRSSGSIDDEHPAE
jgi:hypothetical protein